MKQILITRDVGRIAGRGYVVSINTNENPDVQVGEVVDLIGKGPHLIKAIELSLGLRGAAPLIGLVVQKFTEQIPEPNPTLKTLTQAQAFVQAKREEGVYCPCCGQLCKVYKRTIYAGMAHFLIWLVLEYESRMREGLQGSLWIDILDGPPQRGGDFAKMAHWGLIEQMANDDETKRTSRFWRPTQHGVDFVHARITIPKQVHLYNNDVVGFSSERFDIRDALGKKFNYQELMSK